MGFGRWGTRDAAGRVVRANGIKIWTVADNSFSFTPTLTDGSLANIIDNNDNTRFNPSNGNDSCSDLVGAANDYNPTTWNGTNYGIYTFDVTFSSPVNIGSIRIRFAPALDTAHTGTRIVVNNTSIAGNKTNSRITQTTGAYLNRTITPSSDAANGLCIFDFSTYLTNISTLYVSIYKASQYQLYLYDMSFLI